MEISPENPGYFQWNGEVILPLGVTESGSEGCASGNGWIAISSGFDWQPDLENLLANGGNFVRVIPYFVEQPIQPWVLTPDGRYDLSRYNEAWVDRLEQYLSWTESRGIVVLLEVFENYSFVNTRPSDWFENGAWAINPWNPDNNVNYGRDVISHQTAWEDVAMYKAVTENKAEALALLEGYVSKLLEISLPHGNVIYNISNESMAPLEWSEYWADFIHEYASAQGQKALVGEMPHAFEPSTGLEPIADSPSFDYVDAASQTSQDKFGKDDEAAEVIGTDDTLTSLNDRTQKPISIGKIYYRTPATLWSKFINGAATVRYHRNCDRGGSNEDNPMKYFEYIQHLRTFTDELDLAAATSVDDGLVKEVTDGVQVDVLAAPGQWYVVHLYTEGKAGSVVELSIDLPEGAHSARWFDPSNGNWAEAEGEADDAGLTSFASPKFIRSLALLVKFEPGR